MEPTKLMRRKNKEWYDQFDTSQWHLHATKLPNTILTDQPSIPNMLRNWKDTIAGLHDNIELKDADSKSRDLMVMDQADLEWKWPIAQS